VRSRVAALVYKYIITEYLFFQELMAMTEGADLHVGEREEGA
jgi:hypothetical protein